MNRATHVEIRQQGRTSTQRWIVCTCITTLFSLLLVSCTERIESAREPKLELTEHFYLSIPKDLPVTSISIDSGRAALAWSTGHDSFAELRAQGARLIKGDSGSRLVAAEWIDSGRVGAIFASGRGASYEQLDLDGRIEKVRSFDIPITVTSAIRIGSVWYLAGNDDRKALRLFRIIESGSATSLLSIPNNAGRRDSNVVVAHLSRIEGELIISLARSPYTIWRLNPSTGATVASNPRDDARVDSALVIEHLASWYALRGVAIDSGTVHTLADLASNSRIVFVLTHDGRIINVKKISAPIGFVDSNVRAKRLCAVRTLSTRELVCYTWRWTP